MGLFDSLFDKREKMKYSDACIFIFDFIQMMVPQYAPGFSDATNFNYKTELVGLTAAYLDTKPKEKCTRANSTFGKDMIYHSLFWKDAIENLNHKWRHEHYSNFIQENMDNSVNPDNRRTLALEICRYNNICLEESKVNSILKDINDIFDAVDSLLSIYRFV